MPNQHLQKFMLTLVGNLCDLGQPRTNDFHSTRPISQLNDPKTGEELEAKSVKDLADKVKADVAGINKKLGEYTKTTDALNTLIGTMETAIDAGIELKKEAYRVLHKAEDAGFDAKTAEEAATKVKTDANTAAKTAEAKIAEDAETTDKNAGADISARKNFHDSNLVIDEDNAAEKLKLDGQDAEKKDKDIKNDAGIAKTESESALAEANRLSATSTKQVVEDSKKEKYQGLRCS
uniref:Uncharacterized protein n=1 Tax=Ditylenchus dipsaci TaxID=166011 RepID=A0A915D2C2_9BILA